MENPFYIEFIREIGLAHLGIDVIAFSHSPGMKVFIAAYCISLAYLIVQRLRRKCWFDCTLTELGAMDLYFLWGFTSLNVVLMAVRKSPQVFRNPVLIVCGLVFIGLFVLIAHRPLGFLLECIREYRLSGIIYWFALMGIGLVGIVLLLAQLIIVLLPLVGIFLLVGSAIGWKWNDRTIYRNEWDDDEFI